jgi:hypothetical protein
MHRHRNRLTAITAPPGGRQLAAMGARAARPCDRDADPEKVNDDERGRPDRWHTSDRNDSATPLVALSPRESPRGGVTPDAGGSKVLGLTVSYGEATVRGVCLRS